MLQNRSITQVKEQLKNFEPNVGEGCNLKRQQKLNKKIARRKILFQDDGWCLNTQLEHLSTMHHYQNITMHLHHRRITHFTIQSDPSDPLFIVFRSNKIPRKVGDHVPIQLSVVPTISKIITTSHHLISCIIQPLPRQYSQSLLCWPINYPTQPNQPAKHSINYTVNFFAT